MSLHALKGLNSTTPPGALPEGKKVQRGFARKPKAIRRLPLGAEPANQKVG
jgi:hypothetical protein